MCKGEDYFSWYLFLREDNCLLTHTTNSSIILCSIVIYPNSMDTSSWLSTSIKDAYAISRKCIFSLLDILLTPSAILDVTDIAARRI